MEVEKKYNLYKKAITTMNQRTFYLASGSPQRVRLLREAGYDFQVISHGIEEPPPRGNPGEYAIKSATEKALGGGSKVKKGLVVGADTIVVDGWAILGKPENRQEAFEMLQGLQGGIHKVLTGICIVQAPAAVVCQEVVESIVEMDTLKDEEISAYLQSVAHLEKAGGCDIETSSFTRVVEGSYSNVVGFPLERFKELMGSLCDIKK